MRRQSEHLGDYQAALDRLKALGLLYRCFRTRKEIAEAIASAPHGPSGDQEAFTGGPLDEADEAGADRRGARPSPGACRWRAPRRGWARPGTASPSPSRAWARAARQGGCPPTRCATATWCWPGRTWASPITSPSWLMTRCKGSPTSSAARTCSRRPGSSACCRSCSACPSPSIATTGWCWTRRASGWPSATAPRAWRLSDAAA